MVAENSGNRESLKTHLFSSPGAIVRPGPLSWALELRRCPHNPLTSPPLLLEEDTLLPCSPFP